MREQTHYSALQRQQRQPCADDHAAFIHKSGERKGSKAAGPAVFARARNLPQTSDLIACTRHCASIITACCMRHAVVLRKHQRLLHAACLRLSGKKSSDFMRRFGGCGAHRSFTSRKHCHLGREHRERRQHARAFKKAGDRDLKATMQPRRQEVAAVSLLQATARSRASICAGAGLGLNKQGLEVA